MRVVEVEGKFRGQQAPIRVAPGEAVENVLYRGGYKEMLLTQTELAALGRAVVGIEQPGDRIGPHARCQCLGVGPSVEYGNIERRGRFGAPKPERIHRAPV